MPMRAVVTELTKALGWTAERPREQIRGKGINATKKIYVWSRTAPTSEHIELDGRVAMIREEIYFANIKTAKKTEDFFGDFDASEARETALQQKTATEATRRFAYTTAEEATAAGNPPIPAAAPQRQQQPAARPAPVPTAIADAVAMTMEQQGVGLAAMTAAMAAMQQMMADCREMMKQMNEQSREGRRKKGGKGDEGMDQ
jgi:hypothetical protein